MTWPVFVGLFGKAKEIIDKLTADLDVAVSSRATVDGVWTRSTRTVTGIPSVVKSVQRGLTTITGTSGSNNPTANVTISSVNRSKSFVAMSSRADNINSTTYGELARLTSTTNLELSTRHGGTASAEILVAWEVIEFN